jgi:nucleoporin NUP82
LNPITGVAIPNDVYLTYGIFILTSSMHISSFALNLRSDSPPPRPSDYLGSDGGANHSPFLTPVEGPSPYVSLLSAEPFVPPPALSQPFRLPSQPRAALGSQSSKPEFMLTPETMRYLGTTVERFTAQIHDIQLANTAIESRATLQRLEFKRQQDMCVEMIEAIQTLRVRRSAVAQSKLGILQEAQKTSLARLDRLLQLLMLKASPELSEHEKRWFQELSRMKDEVVGAARYDESSLAARISLVGSCNLFIWPFSFISTSPASTGV